MVWLNIFVKKQGTDSNINFHNYISTKQIIQLDIDIKVIYDIVSLIENNIVYKAGKCANSIMTG